MRALVTGGTSGVGEALANLLEKKGYKVMRVGRAVCDLASDRASLVAPIRSDPPDLLINCAGLAYYGDAASYSVGEQLEMVEVDAAAVVELTLEAVRAWIAKERKGVVVNVSSLLAQIISPGAAVYGASKAFMNYFSCSLDYEVRPRGIRIHACLLGQVRSNFFRRAAGREVEFDPGAISCEEAAEWILGCLDSKRSLHQIGGRHGWLTRICRCMPSRLVNKAIYGILSSRKR